MRVLIADDDASVRAQLRVLLSRSGHEVVGEARDGDEAVALAERAAPELVIIDVKMPRLDGIEAARRVLATRPVPVIMLAAHGETGLVARAVEAGAYGYLVKPFREAELAPAIALARTRFQEVASLRAEVASLAEALAARKVLDRAKGLLMARDGLTEAEAFARIRKASQVSGRPMRAIAEALIATYG